MSLLLQTIGRRAIRSRSHINYVLRSFSVSAPVYQAQPPNHQPHPYQQQHQQQYQQQQNQQQFQQYQQHQQQEEQEPVVHGKPEPDPTAEAPVVFELTERSMDQYINQRAPIIVDIYSQSEINAPAQTAKLVAAAKASSGLIRVGRLNSDRFPELVGNMGLEPGSLPVALFIYGGRQFGQYVGKGEVIEDAELDKKISILYKVAGIHNSTAMLKSAESSLASGDIETAHKTYVELLNNKQLKMEAAALAGLAMCAIRNKNMDEAKELVDIIKANHKEDVENAYVKKAFVALELANVSGSINEEELKEKLKSNPKDLETKYALAVLYSTTNRAEQAVAEALEMIKIDKQFNEQAARKLLLQIFDMLGADHPITVKGRKRLSSLWFL